MSAMHAMALPENDPDSQAAAICRFHGRTIRSRPARGKAHAGETARVPARADGRAPASQAISSRLIAGQPARDRTSDDQTVRDQSSAGGTARGRAASAPAASAPAAALRPASSRAASSRAAALRPASSQAASSRAAALRPASSQAASSQVPRSQAATAAPLRLTRRGRVVVAAAAALLVIVVSLIASGAAQATSHSVPPRVAEQNLTRVIVRPGQTLWSMAESADPGADTRLVVQQIVDLNGLTSDVVLAGQRLWVPRG